MKPAVESRQTIAFLLLCVMVVFCFQPSISGQNILDSSGNQDMTSKESKVESQTVTLKEKIGITVFLIWLWLLIGVGLYFLRTKINEVDRLNELDFFE